MHSALHNLHAIIDMTQFKGAVKTTLLVTSDIGEKWYWTRRPVLTRLVAYVLDLKLLLLLLLLNDARYKVKVIIKANIKLKLKLK